MTEPVMPAGRRADWLDLFRAFRIATDPAKIWTGFLAVVCSGALLLLYLAFLVGVRQSHGGEISRAIWQNLQQGRVVDAGAEAWTGFGMTAEDALAEVGNIGEHLFDSGLMTALDDAAMLQKILVCLVGALVIAWLPWAFYGGMLNRAAAVEYATGERLPRKKARAFALARYPSYFWPPITLLLLALAFFVGVLLVALACANLASAAVFVAGSFVSLYVFVLAKQKSKSGLRAGLAALAPFIVTVYGSYLLWGVAGPVGRVALILSSPLLFLGGLAAAVLLVVVCFGRGVMTATISYEGTDAFDALSRSMDYVLRRPWRLLSYTLVSAAYGVACLSVVVCFAAAAVLIAVVAAWIGFGESFAFLYGAPETAGGLCLCSTCPVIGILIVLLVGLVVGWCVSFVQSVRAIAYALLRKSVDLCETSEILLEAGAGAAKPSAAGTVSQGQP